MTTQEVIGQLRLVHPQDYGEWAFFTEQFQIDAYAIRLWGSSGEHPWRRVAYEVKVSKRDLSDELRRPDKRQGALRISQQFYFAMPLELAEWALPRIKTQAPEAGVLAVLPEGSDPHWAPGPCVGSGANPRTKVVLRAPIRKCRGFTDHEIIALIRRQAQTPGLDEALRLRAEERERANAEAAKTRKAEKERDAFRHQLWRLGALVAVGQVWEREGNRSTVVHVPEARYGSRWGARVDLLDEHKAELRLTITDLLEDWRPVILPAEPARPPAEPVS